MNTKNNQRFKDTEIRMQSVMLELMKYMEFEKITVKKSAKRLKLIAPLFMPILLILTIC
ncbi:hypothetical protein EUBIFOR_00295 [Holdemanella biformis DSM 3989]|uniref:Uncharacterized protein n=1 Tax=Holdemanella biformis DSM 3989 TaxID=518637 RepID=B7C7Z3_9FIRM|nr:hypothetical protein EUBIFOR_00295 [Holdemanella biformis DSM 3989]